MLRVEAQAYGFTVWRQEALESSGPIVIEILCLQTRRRKRRDALVRIVGDGRGRSRRTGDRGNLVVVVVGVMVLSTRLVHLVDDIVGVVVRESARALIRQRDLAEPL